jgi:hypothetical protein
MIEVISLLKVGNVIMTHTIVKIDGQGLLENVRDSISRGILLLSIDDLNGLQNGQMHGSILAPFLSVVDQPGFLDLGILIECLQDSNSMRIDFLCDISLILELDLQSRFTRKLVVLSDEIEY